MKYYVLLVTAVLCLSKAVLSADIAREINQPVAGNNSFTELGISVVSGRLPLVGFNDLTVEESQDTIAALVLGFEARIEYKDFFLEFVDNSFSNLTLGFNAHSTDTSHHELIFNNYFDEIKRSDLQGMETITHRDEDFNLGFRSIYYLGPNVMQFELVHDIVDSHNGFIGALQFGQQKQLRNWQVHGLFGVRYFSDNVVDHLFGVSAAEATDSIAQYQPGGGFMPTVQLGAAIPLNENWIFRATADYAQFPGSVADSPLAQGQETHAVQAGVYYVFNGG